jgi:hypothetical protein
MLQTQLIALQCCFAIKSNLPAATDKLSLTYCQSRACWDNFNYQHIRLQLPVVFSLGTVKLDGRSTGDTAALTCRSLV